MPQNGAEMRRNMSLEQRGYSVLVASASGSFNDALSPLLSEAAISSVHTVANISAAKRRLVERSVDFVMINSPLPDDPGIRFAIDACSANSTVVLLFVKAEYYMPTESSCCQSPYRSRLWGRRCDGWSVQGSGCGGRRRNHCPSKRKWRRSGLSTVQNGC